MVYQSEAYALILTEKSEVVTYSCLQRSFPHGHRVVLVDSSELMWVITGAKWIERIQMITGGAAGGPIQQQGWGWGERRCHNVATWTSLEFFTTKAT